MKKFSHFGAVLFHLHFRIACVHVSIVCTFKYSHSNAWTSRCTKSWKLRFKWNFKVALKFKCNFSLSFVCHLCSKLSLQFFSKTGFNKNCKIIKKIPHTNLLQNERLLLKMCI